MVELGHTTACWSTRSGMRRRRPSSLEAFLSMPPHNFTSCISIGRVVTGDAPCKDGLEAGKDGSHPVHELAHMQKVVSPHLPWTR